MALKGALFLGLPMAIASFVFGQGIGFFGGSIFGGYTAINGVMRYNRYKHRLTHGHGWRHKGWGWRPKGYIQLTVEPQGHHGHHHQGWGWEHGGEKVVSWTEVGPEYSIDGHGHSYGNGPSHGQGHGPSHGSSHGPSQGHGHSSHYGSGWSSYPPIGYYSPPRPSFLSSVRDRIFGHIFGSNKGSSQYGNSGSGWSYGGQDPMNTYYETPTSSDAGESVVHHYDGGQASGTSGGYESAATNTNSDGGYSANTEGYHKDQSQESISSAEVPYSSDSQEHTGNYNSPPASAELNHEPSYQQNQQPSYQQNPEASYQQNPEHQIQSDYNAFANQPESINVYDINGQQASGNAYQYFGDQAAPENVAYGGPDSYDLGSEQFTSKVKAPNAVIQSYLEKKLREELKQQKSEVKRKQITELITMLRDAYTQELLQSFNSEPVPQSSTTASDFLTGSSDYVPNSTTEIPTPAATITTLPGGKRKRIIKRRKKPTTEPKTNEPSRQQTATDIDDEPPRFVHYQTATLVGQRMGTASPLPSPPRQKRQSLPLPSPTADIQALTAFADDIKKFFLLVSVLDQDKCLQKLVCEVHTKKPEEVAKLTPYESNILITFKVMNVLLPANSEDSTTHYRAAAKIGELSKSADVCKKAYSSCTYSSDEIVKMGNQVADPDVTSAAGAGVTTPLEETAQDASSTDGAESRSFRSYVLAPSMPMV